MKNEIENFLSDWYKELPHDQFTAFRLSLTKDILSIIFKSKLHDETKEPLDLGYRSSTSLLRSAKKLIWFLLWSLKWVLRNKYPPKKTILVAIGSNLKTTKDYFSQLKKIADDNNLNIVLLNLISSSKYLTDSSIFYYPRFLYHNHLYVSKNKKMDIANKIISSLQIKFTSSNQLIKKEMKLRKNLNNMAFDYNTFSYLVEKVLFPMNIVALIQDYDYTYNKVLYYHIVTQKNIKTVLIDSSVTLYQHFYTKTYSDFHLVWGEYKKKIILRNNSINPSKVIVIGMPICSKNIPIKENVEKNIWLYIAQSYSDPSMFISGRSFSQLKSNLLRLKEVQNTSYSTDEIVLRLHPADNPSQFKFGIKKSFNNSLDNFVRRAKIIFTEDTTLALELFVQGFPIIYVLDEFNNDNIGLANQNLINSVNLNAASNNEISSIVNSSYNIDIEKRERIKEYYFGSFAIDSFNSVLQNVLLSNEN
jgi:hypothetical protein